MSLPTSIKALKLRVSTGASPPFDTLPVYGSSCDITEDSETFVLFQVMTEFEQTITSATLGYNSVQITNTNLINEFNTRPMGTIFNASIVTTYNYSTLPCGNTISTASLSSFIPQDYTYNILK
jgi:hypothetical protein